MGSAFCLALDESYRYVVHNTTCSSAGLPARVVVSRDPFGRFNWRYRILCVGNLVMATGLCGGPVNVRLYYGCAKHVSNSLILSNGLEEP